MPSDALGVRERLRKAMPISARYAYLDHAAVAPLPACSGDAIQEFARQAVMDGDTRWLEWAGETAQLRGSAAQLLAAHESEIALVPNTTHGIGLIAEGIPWQPGDNVVVPANEFPSNLLPWRNLQRRGVEVRLVEVPSSGEVTVRAVRQHLDRKTRLLAISWVGFASGFRCAIQDMVEVAHRNGTLVFLDAIQGLGIFPLNVQDIDVDFVCADGHKWMLGPEGAGVLFVRQKHLELLQPLNVGWGSLAVGAFDPKSAVLKTSASRYEGGSANMVGMIGFGASLRLLLELGAAEAESPLANAVLENVQELGELLAEQGFECEMPASPENRSGIVGIRWAEAEAGGGERIYQAARTFGLQQHVVTSVRGGRLRIATHAYNNTEDHKRLVDALVEFRKTQQKV